MDYIGALWMGTSATWQRKTATQADSNINQRTTGKRMLLGLATGMAGSAVLTGMTKVILGIYGATGSANSFFDGHIRSMKASDNEMVSQTGRVMDGAKMGFGIGYMSSVIIIALGQHLLGNTLSAMVTVGTAATFTNPIAMTCAAVGAIYYGWSALGTAQKDAILDSITRGLEIGVELIKSVVSFLMTKTKELMSSQSLAEFKALVQDYAGRFGKSLYDVTGKMSDYISLAAGKVGELAQIAGDVAATAVGSTAIAVKEAVNKTGASAAAAADTTSLALKGAYQTTGDAASNLAKSAKQTLGWNKTAGAAQEDTQ
jgi:hypothetical protein